MQPDTARWAALTGDDGASSPGLAAARAALAGAGLAPRAYVDERPQVAVGSALLVGAEPELVEAGPDTWLFHRTTPALVAAVACAAPDGPPAVLVSGLNAGPNTGSAVLHSGTVAAALTAACFGVPAVAVSCDDLHSTGGDEDGPWYWAAAAALAAGLATALADLELPLALSVNVPNLPPDGVRGLCAAPLARTLPSVTVPGPGRPLRPGIRILAAPAGSDVERLRAGWATATVLAGPADRRLLEDLLAAGWAAWPVLSTVPPDLTQESPT
jgi:5'-nucleotidase